MGKKGMGGHQQTEGKNNEWLTDPRIIKSLGEFDLDPCAPIVRPWEMAKHHYTILDDGLKQDWFGRVWMNPPYNRFQIEPWLHRLVKHANGIALLFARTDTHAWHRWIFGKADSIFYLQGRLDFYTVQGVKGPHDGGAPSALIAYGNNNVDALHESGLKGYHDIQKQHTVVTVVIDRTWKTVVTISMERIGGTGKLSEIYEVVNRIAPEKVRSNKNHKAKVRQQLQLFFNKVDRGTYSLN